MSAISKQKNTALRRIKYLVLLQIGHSVRNFKYGNRKKTAVKLTLLAILSVAITAGLTFLFGFIKSYFSFNLNKNLLIAMMFVTQVLGVVSCLSNVTSVLYTSRENTILLAYPCNYDEIFISKLIVFTLDEAKKSCFFTLPFLVSYGFSSGGGLTYFLLLVPMWILLCLFPVVISASLSIVVSWVKRFLQNHVLIDAIFTVVLLVGLFVVAVLARNGFSKVLRELNPDGSAQLRIIAIYGWFMGWLENTVIVTVNKFALWYNFAGSAMFGQSVLLNLGLVLVIFVALALLCFFVAMPFYFKAVSSSTENSRNKKHKASKQHKHSLFGTFFRKEWLLLVRTPSLVSSSITVVLLFPLISFVMNFIVATINTNSLGDYLTVAFNVMITLSLLGTHNANCAMALSSEGSEFAVLKASPSNTMIISWAKCTVSAIINLLAVAVTMVVLVYTTTLKTTDLILTGILILFVSLGQIFWSFQMDINNPKINDYATKGDAVVDNPNVARAIIMSFIVATLFGFLTLILLLDHYTTGWIRVLVIAVAFFVARLYLYQSNLKAYFDEIQM